MRRRRKGSRRGGRGVKGEREDRGWSKLFVPLKEEKMEEKSEMV